MKRKGNPIPKNSNWTDFAKAFDIGVLDLDNFAQKMGFTNFEDLEMSIRPTELFVRNAKKFTTELRNASLKASDLSNEAIYQKMIDISPKPSSIKKVLSKSFTDNLLWG